MKQSSTTAARNKKAKGEQDKKNNGSSSLARAGQGNSDLRQGTGGSNGSRGENGSRKGTAGQSGQGVQGTSNRSGQSNGDQRGSGAARSGSGSGRSGQSGQESFQGESHLEKFFLDQLKDIYYAEQKITQSLPKLKEAATTEELKDAFEDHLHQTQRHVKRLEKVFETLGKKAEGKKCEAIEGITKEVESIIEETEEGSMTRDAALIIAAQKVEHYEIATYGGLVQLAITMELHDAADLLDKTLVEEEDTDARLTEIAENEVNLGADHEGNQYSWDRGDTGAEDETENTEESGSQEEDEDDSSR